MGRIESFVCCRGENAVVGGDYVRLIFATAIRQDDHDIALARTTEAVAAALTLHSIINHQCLPVQKPVKVF